MSHWGDRSERLAPTQTSLFEHVRGWIGRTLLSLREKFDWQPRSRDTELWHTLDATVLSLERGHHLAALGRVYLYMGSETLSRNERAIADFATACVFAAAGSREDTERILRKLKQNPCSGPLKLDTLNTASHILITHARVVAEGACSETSSQEPAALLASVLVNQGSALPKARVHTMNTLSSRVEGVRPRASLWED